MRAHRKKPCPSSPPCCPSSQCRQCRYRAAGVLRARRSQLRKRAGEAPLITLADRRHIDRRHEVLADEYWAKVELPEYYRELRLPRQYSPWVSIMGRMA